MYDSKSKIGVKRGLQQTWKLKVETINLMRLMQKKKKKKGFSYSDFWGFGEF